MLWMLMSLACTETEDSARAVESQETSEQGETGETGETGATPEAVEPFSDCSASDGHGGVTIQDLSITGDTLNAELGYGGGCEVHLFELCWPSQNVEYTDPPQVALQLWHGGVPDPCDLYEIETHALDLRPLREAWQRESGLTTGTLRLNIDGQSIDYSF